MSDDLIITITITNTNAFEDTLVTFIPHLISSMWFFFFSAGIPWFRPLSCRNAG